MVQGVLLAQPGLGSACAVELYVPRLGSSDEMDDTHIMAIAGIFVSRSAYFLQQKTLMTTYYLYAGRYVYVAVAHML